jgi:benzylsuccinate CoA-transferase BbsF subunit
MESHEPLAGVRVLDFCWVLAGPLGTRILANFGAEVIRLESLARPDAFRVRPAPAGRRSLDLGYWFNDVNAGKQSVTLNLSTKPGREIALDLIAKSDVVADNFRPGVLDRLGLGYSAAVERNPGIIYVHLPGCGRDGPWAQRATLGGMLTAAAGLNSAMGFEGMQPFGMGCAYPDFTSPYLLASLVVRALDERLSTGTGQEIWVNQLSSVVSFLGVEWLEYATSGQTAIRTMRPTACTGLPAKIAGSPFRSKGMISGDRSQT